MVCDRCILAVENILQEMQLSYVTVGLGVVDFSNHLGEQLPDLIHTQLSQRLETLGFSLLNNSKSKLIDAVKNSCIDYLKSTIEGEQAPTHVRLSEHINHYVAREYKYLSNLFSEVEGITIEQYFIKLRVETTKELLVYGELSLAEIASLLGYSSVAHLSGQFKKVTGLTPSYFRTVKDQKLRNALDKL